MKVTISLTGNEG